MNPRSALLTLLFLSLASLTNAYEYQTPESAVFDPNTQCYYVSNFRGNSIARINNEGEASDFVTSLSAPLGLVVSGDTLYAIDSPRWVKGFDLKSGEETFSVEIHEAQFLNDLTTDLDGTLWATDSRAGHIYKIELEGRSYDLLLPDVIPGVNGILYDPSQNRLIACRFKNPSSILEIHLDDPKVHVLFDKNILNLDGIATDLNGDFYISTWGSGDFGSGFGSGAGLIYKFEPTFTVAPTVVLKGYDGPADISFNPHHNELLIPLFLSNEFIKVTIESQE